MELDKESQFSGRCEFNFSPESKHKCLFFNHTFKAVFKAAFAANAAVKGFLIEKMQKA